MLRNLQHFISFDDKFDTKILCRLLYVHKSPLRFAILFFRAPPTINYTHINYRKKKKKKKISKGIEGSAKITINRKNRFGSIKLKEEKKMHIIYSIMNPLKRKQAQER